MWFAHVRHSRNEELPHECVGNIAGLSCRPPIALIIRNDGIGVCLINVPAGGASCVARLLVDHLDPLAGGIGAMPVHLALDGILNSNVAGRRWRALDGKEELFEVALGALIGIKFTPDEFVKFGVRSHYGQLERHLVRVKVCKKLEYFFLSLCCTSVLRPEEPKAGGVRNRSGERGRVGHEVNSSLSR